MYSFAKHNLPGAPRCIQKAVSSMLLRIHGGFVGCKDIYGGDCSTGDSEAPDNLGPAAAFLLEKEKSRRDPAGYSCT